MRIKTIGQSSNIFFLIWHNTMILLTVAKQGFSKEIQRQLALKRYIPVWTMIHKLRKTRVNKDHIYTLVDIVIEIDEDYFSIEALEHKIQIVVDSSR